MIIAKKKYGQNFLKCPETLHIIATYIDLSNENILEIGPGMGDLSREIILQKPNHFAAVEIDRRMQDHLDFIENLIFADILKIDLTNIFDDKFYILGNIPYNISSPILFKIIDNIAYIKAAVIMMQKELAQRIVSESTSKAYGRISVAMQSFFTTKHICTVEAEKFTPKPKVTSQVIYIKPKENIPSAYEYKILSKITNDAFSQRRKMLRKSLAYLMPILDKMGIDGTLRAENLSPTVLYGK